MLIGGAPQVVITEYPVTTVAGTGPLALNSALVNKQVGVPTSAGATVVVTSNIPTKAVGTQVVYFGEMFVSES